MSFLGPRHTNFLPYPFPLDVERVVCPTVLESADLCAVCGKKNKNHLRPVFSERLVSPAPLLFHLSMLLRSMDCCLLLKEAPGLWPGACPRACPASHLLPLPSLPPLPLRCPFPAGLPAAALF